LLYISLDINSLPLTLMSLWKWPRIIVVFCSCVSRWRAGPWESLRYFCGTITMSSWPGKLPILST